MTSINNLLDEMLDKDQPAVKQPETTASVDNHRERLIALVVGGKARLHLGKELSVDKIDGMSNEEVEKLYARYESRLGATMTKT